MPRVNLRRDEYYPFYKCSYNEVDCSIEFTNSELEEFKLAMETFSKWQRMIETNYCHKTRNLAYHILDDRAWVTMPIVEVKGEV